MKSPYKNKAAEYSRKRCLRRVWIVNGKWLKKNVESTKKSTAVVGEEQEQEKNNKIKKVTRTRTRGRMN